MSLKNSVTELVNVSPDEVAQGVIGSDICIYSESMRVRAGQCWSSRL